MPETQSGIDAKQNTKLGAISEVVIQWHSLYIATDSGHTYHQLASCEQSGKSLVDLTLARTDLSMQFLYLVDITKKSIF